MYYVPIVKMAVIRIMFGSFSSNMSGTESGLRLTFDYDMYLVINDDVILGRHVVSDVMVDD